MTITEAISDVYLRATGKPTAPSAGTRKYNQIVALLDFYQRRWAREPGINWNSLYDPAFSIGNVTATDTFDLDVSTIRSLSNREGDAVRIVWTDGVGYSDYSILAHDALSGYSYGVNRQGPIGSYVARVGNTLVFNHTFTSSDSQFGGEIFIPSYIFPDEITATSPDSNEVQVDDPDWLVTRVAAEYVRNDITRRQRYPELLAEANEIMGRMIDDNDGQISRVDTPWEPFTGSNDAWV